MKTLKAIALDFVEKNGPTRRKDIIKHMWENSNYNFPFNPIECRGYFSSYFCRGIGYDRKGILRKPTKKDRRYLVQTKPYGPYTVAYAK